MRHIATITFVDADSGDEACITVRSDDASVGLSVSIKANGDIETFMSKEDAVRLVEALKLAVS